MNTVPENIVGIPSQGRGQRPLADFRPMGAGWWWVTILTPDGIKAQGAVREDGADLPAQKRAAAVNP